MGLAIALTATIATVAQPETASTQIIKIATGALDAIAKSKQPQIQVIQQQVSVSVSTALNKSKFDVGNSRDNGNSLNLCIFDCLSTESNN